MPLSSLFVYTPAMSGSPHGVRAGLPVLRVVPGAGPAFFFRPSATLQTSFAFSRLFGRLHIAATFCD